MRRLVLIMVALGCFFAWRSGIFSRRSAPRVVAERPAVAPSPRPAWPPVARPPIVPPGPRPQAQAPARPARSQRPQGAPGSDPRFAQADAYLSRGQYDAAERLLGEILSAQPRNGDALVEMGVLYADLRNQPDKAVPYLRRAVEANPENADALEHLLGATTRASGVGETASTLRDLYSLYPDSAALNGEMGRMSASHGSLGDALQYFEKAVRKGATVDTQLDYAGALLASRQAGTAREVLRGVLEKDPTNEPARAMLQDAERGLAE